MYGRKRILWYTVAGIEVNWNSLCVVILFIKPGACVQERGNLCRFMTEEVTVVCNNLHSIYVLLHVVNRQPGEWQSICLF